MQGDWSRFAYPVQRSYGISVDEWSDQPLVPALFSVFVAKGEAKNPNTIFVSTRLLQSEISLELCGQVSVHDLNYWNLILSVVYSYMEVYLKSVILCGCTFTGFSSHRITSMFLSSAISMVAPTWCHGPI